MDAAIEAGQLDWSGAFIPNIKQVYLAKDPKFVVSDIPLATTFLVPNMATGPTTKLAVRQAISAAHQPQLHQQHGLQRVRAGLQPRGPHHAQLQQRCSTRRWPARSFSSPSAAAAKSLLARAGIKTPLSLTVKMVAGYTDYLSDLQIIQQELKPAGINLSIDQEAYTAFISDQDNGNFQLLMDSFGFTPDPWSYYYSPLDSAITKPIGTADTAATSSATRTRRWTRCSARSPGPPTCRCRSRPSTRSSRSSPRTCRSSRCGRPRTRSSSTGTTSSNMPTAVEPLRRAAGLHPAGHRLDVGPARPGEQVVRPPGGPARPRGPAGRRRLPRPARPPVRRRAGRAAPAEKGGRGCVTCPQARLLPGGRLGRRSPSTSCCRSSSRATRSRR